MESGSALPCSKGASNSEAQCNIKAIDDKKKKELC
jgi:hypothetical protein